MLGLKSLKLFGPVKEKTKPMGHVGPVWLFKQHCSRVFSVALLQDELEIPYGWCFSFVSAHVSWGAAEGVVFAVTSAWWLGIDCKF